MDKNTCVSNYSRSMKLTCAKSFRWARSWLQLIVSKVAISISCGFPGYRQQCIIPGIAYIYVAWDMKFAFLYFVILECTLPEYKLTTTICLIKFAHNGPFNDTISFCIPGLIFSCDQAALRTLLSVRPSVRLSHFFHNVPVIASSFNFHELLPLTKVISMQKVKDQGHSGHDPI